MVLVPCCQAELAACLRHDKALHLARTPLAELWRHPLHTREFGSQLTNVLRCLRLEASGYQVTVTELVGWEHSLKNELIIARYTGQKNAAPPNACTPSWPNSGSSRRWARAFASLIDGSEMARKGGAAWPRAARKPRRQRQS